jgi:hypothetical protein
LTVGRLGNAGGPAKEYRPIMGADEFLLREFVSDRHSATLFPTSDSDAAKSPLVKGAIDPVLHLTIGNLKQLNATANGVPGALPQTNWFNPSGDVLQGADLLDVHGPMFFELLRLLLPKLIPELGEAFCAVKNADDIKVVMGRNVRWCASTNVYFILSHVTCHFMQDKPSIREGQGIARHGLAVVFLDRLHAA